MGWGTNLEGAECKFPWRSRVDTTAESMVAMIVVVSRMVRMVWDGVVLKDNQRKRLVGGAAWGYV